MSARSRTAQVDAKELAMPRLRAETLKAIQHRIESAALAQFIKSGYAATTTREIAQAVGLTPGALYSHYPSKEALFAAVVRRYQRELLGVQADNDLVRILKNSRFPYDIPELAAAIRELVSHNRAYWLLWYIDIVEFEGKHFRSQVAPQALLGAPELKQRFDELRESGALRVEPELAFVMVYMHLFNYFCVEALFGGNNHYGVPEEIAVATMTEVFLNGMLARAPDPR
jgi:AcrR family transcriptional regulator